MLAVAATDPRHGRYLTVAAYFRGKGVSMRDVEENMSRSSFKLPVLDALENFSYSLRPIQEQLILC